MFVQKTWHQENYGLGLHLHTYAKNDIVHSFKMHPANLHFY